MLDNIASCYSFYGKKSYSDMFSNIDVYYEYDFFLACKSYCVLVPVKGEYESKLNIFELTVLRLFSLQYWSNEDLAEKMGVELDFVNFIVVSLQEKQYLTEDGKLTELAHQEVNGSVNSEGKIEYKTARIFALKQSNELLPVICFNENNIVTGEINRDRHSVSFSIGSSAGTEKRVPYRYYSSGKSEKRSEIPSKNDVVRLFADYRRLHKKGYTNVQNLQGSQLSIEASKDVFVHFKAVLQRNNLDVKIISDGLAQNDNQVVAYFESLNEFDFFAKLFERANIARNKKNERTNNLNTKYNQITKFLQKSHPKKGNNRSERKDAQRHNWKAISNLFAALEWSLHFYIQNNAIDNTMLKCMKEQDRFENGKLAYKMAQKLGFVIPHLKADLSRKLLNQASGNKIANYYNSKIITPNMDLLLPLCLVQAGNDSSSAWHEIAVKYPGLLGALETGVKNFADDKITEDIESSQEELQDTNLDTEEETNETVDEDETANPTDIEYTEEELKLIANVKFNFFLMREMAKQVRHNDKERDFVDYIKVKAWYDKVYELIKLLLPDYDSMETVICNEDLADQMVGDITSILSAFNFSMLDLQKLPEAMYREILSISPNRDNDSDFFENDFVISLSKILESYFREKIYLQDISVADRKTHLDAVNYLIHRLEGADLPNYIRTIKPTYYYSAVQGNVGSLGAYVLVWASHNDEDKYTGEYLKDILELVGKVAALRKHGNSVSFEIDKSGLLDIRNKVLNMIKEMEG